MCDSDVDYDQDQLVSCDMCGITVHQSCYGVQELPGEDDMWLCRACELKVSYSHFPLLLCTDSLDVQQGPGVPSRQAMFATMPSAIHVLDPLCPYFDANHLLFC